MYDGFVKVAAMTPQVYLADPDTTIRMMTKTLLDAERDGVQVLVLPELCLTGATCGDLFHLQTLQSATLSALFIILRNLSDKNILVFMGLPFQVCGELYDCAAVLCRGKVLGLVPKAHLSPGEDGRWFSTPAKTFPTTAFYQGEEIPFGTDLLFQSPAIPRLIIGCEVGDDLFAPVPPSTTLVQSGASVVVNLAAPRAQVGETEWWDLLATGQSARLHCGYILAGAGAGESSTDAVYSGLCRIYENGTLLASKDTSAPGMITAELDLERIWIERQRYSRFAASNEARGRIISCPLHYIPALSDRLFDPSPFLPEGIDRAKRCKQIMDIQAAGLAQRLSSIHCSTAVLGLSGGLDSTLALLVTVQAFDQLGFPRDEIHAVTLPCFGTTKRTHSNAWWLAQLLGVHFEEIPIGDAVSQHFRDIGLPETDRSVTFENAQARERTQVLFDLANKLGGIVVGTGDLSELALGWATYNGDHMSSYDVNADVPKTVIRAIVSWYASLPENQNVSSVLLDILATPISPELLPPTEGDIAQKTEDLVGPYEIHDFYLYYALRWGFEPSKIFHMALSAFRYRYDGLVLLHWLRNFYERFFAMQFKRNCLTDGPQIGTVTLSPRGGWVMPSDANWTVWKYELERVERVWERLDE